MKDFSLVTGLVLVQYVQYTRGEVLRQHDQWALGKFEEFLFKQMRKPRALQTMPSIIKRDSRGQQKERHVMFLEEAVEEAREQGRGFTKELFLYQVDKFFGKDSTIILQCTDDEYDMFLAKEKQDQDEFQQTLQQMDQFFLTVSEPDRDQPVEERDAQVAMENTGE